MLIGISIAQKVGSDSNKSVLSEIRTGRLGSLPQEIVLASRKPLNITTTGNGPLPLGIFITPLIVLAGPFERVGSKLILNS